LTSTDYLNCKRHSGAVKPLRGGEGHRVRLSSLDFIAVFLCSPASSPNRQKTKVRAHSWAATWPIAEARLKLNADEITTPCFIAPNGPVLLGAVALESLFVAVDPIGKRLIPVDGIVG